VFVLICRCKLPYELVNASYDLPPDVMNMSYPFDFNTGGWSSCEVYDTNVTNTSNELKNSSIRYCDQWVYDKSEFQNTAIMEVNANNMSSNF